MENKEVGEAIILDARESKVVPKEVITCVLNVTHHPLGEQSTNSAFALQRELETHEECYTRRMLIGPAWKCLEYGPLEHYQVGFILLQNNMGVNQQLVPSDKQRAKIARSVVEIALGEIGTPLTPMLLYPGWPLLFCPSDASLVVVRSQCVEEIPCRITAYPR